MIGEKYVPYTKKQYSLKADVILQFPEQRTPFYVFSAVSNLDGLVKLLVIESNFHAKQNGREFHTNEQEMRSFLEINYIMSINKLPAVKRYLE